MIASKKGILPNIDSINKEIDEIESSRYFTERDESLCKCIEKDIVDLYKDKDFSLKINYTTEKKEEKNIRI